jgi:hypothetical protein
MRAVIREELQSGGSEIIRALDAAERGNWRSAKVEVKLARDRLDRILRVMEREWSALLSQK